jgi:hypothetical protein
MISRALVTAAALALAAAPAAHAKKPPPPPPYVDTEHGFQLQLPAGWLRVEQDTGLGATAPLYKAASDATDQWLVVILTKGPTDDADGDGKPALDNFEAGFAKADAYKRLSIQRRDIAPAKPAPGQKTGKPKKLPAIDLWFTMQRAGKPVVVGARTLLFRSYALTLVVDAPGSKVPRATRTLLESFQPTPPPPD